MTDDLVQRLRRTYRKEFAVTGSMFGDISNRLRPFPILATEVLFNPDGREAADRIEALEAKIERLRERVKRVENNNRELRGSKERVYAATDLRVALDALGFEIKEKKQ